MVNDQTLLIQSVDNKLNVENPFAVVIPALVESLRLPAVKPEAAIFKEPGV